MKEKTEEPIFALREDFPCPYFGDQRISSIEYLLPDEEASQNFHEFLAEGYRRLGTIFYRNVCEQCTACKPIRLIPKRFKPSRSQKRTWKKNEDVNVKILSSPSVTSEKISLFGKYQNSKHRTEDSREYNDYNTFLLTIHYGYNNTVEMDYYLENRLIGVGIVDEGADSLSSNYFYYDTDYLERRPGVLSILHEISLAEHLGKKYYYLGFYIEENEKMSYKKFFRPNQIYKNGAWRDFLRE